jgi:tRNA(adenine34) deaminase
MVLTDSQHIKFMRKALHEAKTAAEKCEVPIGAVIIDKNNQLLSATHNLTVTLKDPTAHAEILAIREASQKINNYRLLNTTLYVTIEPCIMCMGSLVHARVYRIVFGAKDSKWGAAGSLYNFSNDHRLNHHPKIISGICEKECALLMQSFFCSKRKLNNIS